ncbi:MAG: NrdH-redoxin [Acidimicrobiales bacterium]|nr:NrdH-redoxin [Acidimicrobiales bacterium]
MSDSVSGAAAAEPAIDYYWRPGCPFCTLLERRLNKLDVKINRFNIWDSPADAAFVRSVANGSETVPTLRIGETSLVNPSAGEVSTVLAAEFPGSFSIEPDKPSGLRGMLSKRKTSD